MAGPNPYAEPQSGAAQPIPCQLDASGKVLLLPPGKEASVRVSAIGSMKAVMSDPNWIKLVAWGALAIFASQIIPVVPQIVYLGYLLYLAEAKIRVPSQPLQEFTFDFLMKYLVRGVWTILAYLVWALILAIPLGIVYLLMFGALMLTMTAVGPDAAPVVLIPGVLLMMLVWTIIIGSVGIVIAPACFRAGMCGSFGEGFKFNWIKSFVGKTWKEALLGWIVLGIAGFFLSILGILACLVGVLFVTGFMMIAQFLYMADLYLLFLSRGGEPIAMDRKVTLEEIAS